MGQSNVKGMTQEMLEEYSQLTYLTKSEILRYVWPFFSLNKGNLRVYSLYKIFQKFGANEMEIDFHHRFSFEIIKEHFPQIKVNFFLN